MKHLIFILILSFSNYSLGDTIRSYSNTKHILKSYYRHNKGVNRTIYLGCKIDRRLEIDINNCKERNAYTIPFLSNKKINFEHVVPSSRIKRHVGCTRPRQWCANNHSEFKRCYGQLRNIYPVIPIVNLVRGSSNLNKVHGGDNVFKGIDIKFEINEDGDRVIEPPNRVKGLVARSYLYMDKIDCISLSYLDKTTYEKWNLSYPVSRKERLKNAR